MTKNKGSRRSSRCTSKTARYMIKIEIRAAEICNLRLMSPPEGNGWRAHAKNSLSCAPIGNEHAGWLARELSTHDDHDRRDEGCWSWDITKPLTAQWPNVPGMPLRDCPRIADDEVKAVASTLGIDTSVSVGLPACPVDELGVPNRRIKDMIRGFVLAAEKPTGDPLDAAQRCTWNADLDAVERGQ